jgi:protein-tyrosine phosphatase
MIVSKVLPWLYIGNCTSAHSIALLRQHHIKMVINLHDEHLDPIFDEIEYKLIPLVDGDGNKWERIEEILRVLDEGKKLGNVLIHCCGGMSRSPFVVLAYLILRQGWSMEKAIRWLKSVHPITNINPKLLIMLKANSERK